ncbi:MAG: GHKL domain-containing protein [Clostridia bacterium]|nr:GHKL domain-containing protein [Clostridia bacterium]
MKKIFNSVRAKLSITLCIVIIMIIGFLVIVNRVILETLYYNSKKNSSLETYEYIRKNVNDKVDENIKYELEKNALNNSFDILILKNHEVLFSSADNFLSNFNDLKEVKYNVGYNIFNKSDILYSTEEVTISSVQDKTFGMDFIVLSGEISENIKAYIRISIAPITDSVKISNQFLLFLGFATAIIGVIAIFSITEHFTKPIEELNDIANDMANLDFSKKYRLNDSEDEINELGRSINILSDKLEDKIKELKQNNIELEKDIEERSKIDEMRKQFISDVSHELKTPISLIQGYAEGLIDNVATDENGKKFYSEVILDEANKMDKLVKRLLELMKLEYGERKFNNKTFDLSEVINEVIRYSKVKLEEKEIEVEFNDNSQIKVYADDFYIEQVVTNYFTNAIKNVLKVNGKKKIIINVKNAKNPEKLRVSIFNTGENIEEEDLNRIWNRFYKVDSSRNRENGGTGIGLSLVKAIMTQYNNSYGVKNKVDGVEFYFEINKSK